MVAFVVLPRHAAAGDFTFYDATLPLDSQPIAPDTRWGTLNPAMIRMQGLGANLFHSDWAATFAASQQIPPVVHLPETLKIKDAIATVEEVALYVDVEHLVGDSPEAVDYFRVLMGDLQAALPGVVVGAYAMHPERQFWLVQEYQRRTAPQAYLDWQRRNDVRNEFASSIDIALPSLYTFYTRAEEAASGGTWEAYAIHNILEARKTGKRVCPVVWMQYHSASTTVAYQFIDAVFWREQLDLIAKWTDCIVLWGLWQDENGVRLNFDPSEGWYQATLEFMAERRPVFQDAAD